MKYKLIFAGIILTIATWSHAGTLVPHADLTYQGAFKMPADTVSACYQWQGIQGFIVYNHAGDGGNGSLIVSTRIGCPTVGEIDIPTPSIEANKVNLPIANILQATTDVSAGALQDTVSNNTGIGIGNMVILPSLSGNRILAVTHKNYNTESTSYWDESVTSFGMDFSTTLDSSGWFQITGKYIGATGQYLFTVPQTWADAHTGGKNVIIGGSRFAGGGSHGMSLYAIDTWASNENPPANGSDFTPLTISEYTNGTTQQMDNYGYSNQPGGVLWIETTNNDTVVANGLYFGRWRLASDTSTNDWTSNANGMYYGNPHPEGTGGKGYNNEPYAFALLLYNPDDFAASLAGSIEPWEVQPYAYYNWAKYAYQEPYYTGITPKNSGGVAYNDSGDVLYVVERLVGEASIVHVFAVTESAGTLDVTPPTQPSNLSIGAVTETSIALSWTGSTDSETDVTYVINLNGYPVLRTTETSYNYGSTGNFVTKWRDGDGSADGFPAIESFSFTVTAIDDYFNESPDSNSVTHNYAGSNGGQLQQGNGNLQTGTGFFQ